MKYSSIFLLSCLIQLTPAFAQQAKIGSVDVKIEMGDVTQQGLDAIAVPHFAGAVSWGGVGAAVARRGGEDGLLDAEKFFGANSLSFGDAFVTESPAMRVKLVNLVSVGSGKDVEFSIVQQATINGLDKATMAGVTSLAMPALGTGIIGSLTAQQSARAILSAVQFYASKGGSMREIRVVIYGDQAAYTDFVEVLNTRAFEQVDTLQLGERKFDFARAAKEMAEDHGVAIVPTLDENDCEKVLGVTHVKLHDGLRPKKN